MISNVGKTTLVSCSVELFLNLILKVGTLHQVMTDDRYQAIGETFYSLCMALFGLFFLSVRGGAIVFIH